MNTIYRINLRQVVNCTWCTISMFCSHLDFLLCSRQKKEKEYNLIIKYGYRCDRILMFSPKANIYICKHSVSMDAFHHRKGFAYERYVGVFEKLIRWKLAFHCVAYIVIFTHFRSSDVWIFDNYIENVHLNKNKSKMKIF